MRNLEEHLDQIFDAAKTAHDEGREIAASELLSVYVRHRPGHATAWHIYGDALRVIGLYHEANQALSTAYDLNQSPWIAGRIAKLHYDHGKFSEADAWFTTAGADTEVAAKSWHWILRGGNLEKMNQFVEAERCFRKALDRKETEQDEAYLAIARVLIAQGKYQEATVAIHQVLQVIPAHEEALKVLRKLDGIEQALLLIKDVG